MIDWLKEIDQNILLAINGANSPALDVFMWWVSEKIVWFPLYLFLFILVYKKYSLKYAIWFTVFGFAAVGLCDFTTTHLFKYPIARYRPSHHLYIGELLHFYEYKPGHVYKGGMYGFVSGHSSNSTLIALMFIQQLRSYYKYITPLLILWVLLVVYSRMYLGVHYPSDIIGGMIWGSALAFGIHWIYRKVILKQG